MFAEILGIWPIVGISTIFAVGVWWDRHENSFISSKEYGRQFLKMLSVTFFCLYFVGQAYRHNYSPDVPEIFVQIFSAAILGWFSFFIFRLGRSTRARIRDIGRLDDRWAYALAPFATYFFVLAILCMFRSKQPRSHGVDMPSLVER